MRLWLALLLSLVWVTLALAQTQDDTRDRVQEALEQLERTERGDRLGVPTPPLGEPAPHPGLRERITRYDVDITVQPSGDMVVEERIDVVAAGREIKRGIFREFPAHYTFMGVRRDYEYQRDSVTRNGRPEPVTTRRNGNAITWRMGSRDVFLPHGAHEYRLRYRVSDAVRRHDDRDELYWNVLGAYTVFPVEDAAVTIAFPPGAEFTDLSVYAGARGTNTKGAVIDATGDIVTARLTEPLAPREGLTVSVSLAKGVIDPLSDAERAQIFWLRNGAAILLGAGGTGLLLFYLVMWARIGRDPPRPPVFARYAPPEGYGPGAVHYIYHRGMRGMKALSAELLGLGTSGAVEIDAGKSKTVITQTGAPRTEDGKYLLDALRPYGAKRIVMDGKPDTHVFKGAQQYAAMLARRYGRDYYRRNLGWAILGIVASVALVFVVLNAPVAKNSIAVVGLFIALIALNIVFLRLLPAPTKKGSRVHSEIAGFKLYLETAEKDRINTGGPLSEQPPMMSVELYERFLPYAVALGVEKNWTRYFHDVLPREAEAYRPAYARGSRFDRGRGGLPQIGRTVDRALSTGVAAAAPISQSTGSGSSGGWSSGSGGGGFSGGGGGGGGVGGW